MPGRISEPVGPVDGRKVPRFAGSGSFGRLPEIDRVPDYDVAVLGAPFDSGTSYRPGARFGPMAVRQASRHLRPGHHVELDCSPFSAIQVVDAGDVPVTPFSIDEAMAQIAGHAADLLQGDRKVIAVGGDHTIALPMLRSVASAHGPVALVHFDAHLDTWDTYFNAPTTHGTIFRQVEVAPAYDHAEITSIAAATMIFDIIALLSRRALSRSPQSWAASMSLRASSAGRVNITSWLPAM